MKRHFWQYILNTKGEPLQNIRIHVFLADKVTRQDIMDSSKTNNVLIDIPSDAYAFVGKTQNTTVNNFETTEKLPADPPITTTLNFLSGISIKSPLWGIR